MLQRFIFLFLLVSNLHPVCGQSSVFFGERDLNSPRNAVHFDLEGSIYPDYFIADTSMRNSGSTLNGWYSKHPQDFENIARDAGCTFSIYSPGHATVLQDSLLHRIRRKIEQQQNGSVTFLIHGFRKSYVAMNADVPSRKEFEFTEQTIALLDTGQRHCFVEVYWDARYDCCFSSHKKQNKVLFGLFTDAQQSAIPIGQNLRKLLSGLHCEQINILAHSLGAQVATSALFEVAGPCLTPTPQQKTVNLCLLVPAMAGEDIFQHYYNRYPARDTLQPDNYRLLIVYNEHDFVLKKKDSKTGLFGPGVYRYGNTTLGCNYKGETTKLAAYFLHHFPGSYLQLQDMSVVGKCHSIRCYCIHDYLREVVRFTE